MNGVNFTGFRLKWFIHFSEDVVRYIKNASQLNISISIFSMCFIHCGTFENCLLGFNIFNALQFPRGVSTAVI